MKKLEADWLKTAASQQICGLLEAQGYQALFVGGCVRNALLKAPVSDLDIATDANPDRVVEVFEAANLQTIPTGIAHGTITVIADHTPYEITTFRRDVSTDGRRATVAFSNKIQDDAARRDFTMNALYVKADGTILDPLSGLEDLLAHRLRFIGDAHARIREDYLRILRFFRFHAIYGDPAAGIDPEGLAACAELAEGITQLSAERVGSEMRKLLGAVDPGPSVASMVQAGVLGRVLPGAAPKALALLVHLESEFDIPARWQRRLAVLGLRNWDKILRLSRAEQRVGKSLRNAIEDAVPASVTAYRFGAEIAVDAVFCQAALMETSVPKGWQAEVESGAAAQFPVQASDLMPPLAPGPNLGIGLKYLEKAWIASGFTHSKETLLAIDIREAF